MSSTPPPPPRLPSDYDHQHCLSGSCRHRLSSETRRRQQQQQQQQQQHGTVCVDAVRNAFPSISQQLTTARSTQVANQFQHLQLNDQTSHRSATQPVTTNDRATIMVNRLRNESWAEDQLIDELKESINQFMQRPHRQFNYNNTIRWTVDPGNGQDYSVVILINRPSALI